MKHRSDEELVAEIAGRDHRRAAKRRAALGELIRRYERPLYSYLMRFACDESMAEDLFQDCFLRLARSAWRFDTAKPLRPWLYTIAANLARDELRRKRWQVEVSLDRAAPSAEGTVASVLPGDCDPPDEVASAREEARVLRAAVAELDEPFRRVVELHFFEALTCRETAAAMGIPLGTVKSRLHTALERLGAALGQSAERRAAG